MNQTSSLSALAAGVIHHHQQQQQASCDVGISTANQAWIRCEGDERSAADSAERPCINEPLLKLREAMTNQCLINDVKDYEGLCRISDCYLQTECVGKILPRCQRRTYYHHRMSVYGTDCVRLKLDEKNLRKAATSGDLSQVKELLENGVNPRACDDKQRTALHIAAAAGHESITRLLLDHGADPNQKDIIGNTALHLATCTHNISIITLLLEKGADVSMLDRSGTSPLHMVLSRLRLAQSTKLGRSTSEQFKNELFKIIDMMRAYLHRIEHRLGGLSLGGQASVDSGTETGGRDDDRDLTELCDRLGKTSTQEDMDCIGSVLSDLAQLHIDRIGTALAHKDRIGTAIAQKTIAPQLMP